MPLLTHGSFDAFRAVPSGPARSRYDVVGDRSFATLRELTRELQPVPIEFLRSAGPVRVALRRLTLTAASRCMLRRILVAEADVELLGWAWDLSGAPPSVLPVDRAASWRLDLVEGARRLGREVVLWDGRPVVGGVCVRLIAWQGGRGDVVGEVAEAMRHSRLAAVLTSLPDASRTTITSAVMVREAAGVLGGEIAPVLRALCPDYVDLCEGFIPVTAAGWEPAEFGSRDEYYDMCVRTASEEK